MTNGERKKKIARRALAEEHRRANLRLGLAAHQAFCAKIDVERACGVHPKYLNSYRREWSPSAGAWALKHQDYLKQKRNELDGVAGSLMLEARPS